MSSEIVRVLRHGLVRRLNPVANLAVGLPALLTPALGQERESALAKRHFAFSRSGLKQAAKEVDKIRDLAERGMFVATRMPLLCQAYVELIYTQAMNKPEARNLMDNVDQLTEVLCQVPDLILSSEEPVRGVLSDVNQTVTAANELANSINTLAARFVPERPPGWQPEPSETLDLEQVQGALASLTGVLEQADGMEAEAEDFTGRSFLQAIELMAIFFVLLLAYRFVSHRLIATPGWG